MGTRRHETITAVQFRPSMYHACVSVGCVLALAIVTSVCYLSVMKGGNRMRLLYTLKGSKQHWTDVDPVQLAACVEAIVPDLPLSPSRKCTAASHHYDAQTGKWNEDIRFRPLSGVVASQITAVPQP